MPYMASNRFFSDSPLALAAAGLLLLTAPLSAQVRSRITRPPDPRQVVRVPSTHPLAVPANERGRLAGDTHLDRMLLVLASAPEQQAALDQLLAEQQDPASPRYRQWLTPEEFGRQFGPSDEDLQAVTDWLSAAGFRVAEAGAGRRTLEFSGTSSQVEAAFQTEMHRYQVNGESHIANSTDIAIPAALAPVVRGVASLHDFPLKPTHRVLRPAPQAIRHDYNISSNTYALAPYDFAAIYDVLPLWKLGFTGAGQSVAIVAHTNINLNDVTTFRSTFGLPANPVQMVINGTNPGIISAGEETEADLDVEWSGAVAQGAAIKLVVSASTATTDGILLSASYIVNNNLAAAMSTSFSACEAALGASENAFFDNTWSQAAAEGIAVFVSAGDSGSAGCDLDSSTSPATHGLAVNGIASTPYNVAVGGTQFDDTASPSTYWNSSMASNFSSAKGYIPEIVWNQSSYSPGASGNSLYAGSGGVSSLYATPSWQTGKGVPAADPGTPSGHHRYLPDVSLSGSTHDGYLVEQEGILYEVGGTSAGSPAFAGLMAIVTQYNGARVGNPNATLYPLAAGSTGVFHDVTSGTNAVPCAGGSSGCSATAAGKVGVMNGYSAGAGFDLATGLGSVDAYNLALAWKSVTPPPAITAVTPNPVVGSASAKTLTIAGARFASGAGLKVTLTSAAGAVLSLTGSQVTFVNSNGLTVSAVLGTTGQTWSVVVTNPNGESSNNASLTVDAPPAITSLSPNPMTASASNQTLTIDGSGFQSGAKVLMTAAGKTTTYSGSSISSTGATQLKVTVNVGTAAQTWTVEVENPDGGLSAVASLTVQASSSGKSNGAGH